MRELSSGLDPRAGGPRGAAPARDGYKRPFDLALLGLALVGLAPVWAALGLAIALAVRLEDGGPALYRQARLGRGGVVFDILKFRSMAVDAEAATGPVWTQFGDPRVTRVGRLLRRFHLDELPQALNVLRGDMSLVGPRPERPQLAARIERGLPGFSASPSRAARHRRAGAGQRRRLARPGAQAALRQRLHRDDGPMARPEALRALPRQHPAAAAAAVTGPLRDPERCLLAPLRAGLALVLLTPRWPGRRGPSTPSPSARRCTPAVASPPCSRCGRRSPCCARAGARRAAPCSRLSSPGSP